MTDRDGIFAGDSPFDILRRWLEEASATEVNDANAMTLSTVDADGMPNARIVLLKDVEDDALIFYTNYESQKAKELVASGKAALLLHWKSLRRQIRVRGTVTKEDGAKADAYYDSRALQSRIGAWASDQSRPLASRSDLMNKVEAIAREKGDAPTRPPFWGGFRLTPSSFEFWSEGEFRLHDRFRWVSAHPGAQWSITRLYP